MRVDSSVGGVRFRASLQPVIKEGGACHATRVRERKREREKPISSNEFNWDFTSWVHPYYSSQAPSYQLLTRSRHQFLSVSLFKKKNYLPPRSKKRKPEKKTEGKPSFTRSVSPWLSSVSYLSERTEPSWDFGPGRVGPVWEGVFQGRRQFFLREEKRPPRSPIPQRVRKNTPRDTTTPKYFQLFVLVCTRLISVPPKPHQRIDTSFWQSTPSQ